MPPDALICTKFKFFWGSPRPHWGSLQRSPDPLAGLRWAASRQGREGEGTGGDGRGGEALAVELSHFSTGSDATALAQA